jgi:hypothetical protein
MIQKQLQHKKILPVYAQKEIPKISSGKSKQNYHYFQLNLKKMAQAQNVNILHAKQSDASIQFYDANHL